MKAQQAYRLQQDQTVRELLKATKKFKDTASNTHMKRCVTCDSEKHEDVFVKRDGKVLGQCKECRNAYVRQYKHDRADETRAKQEIVITNGGKTCVQCHTWKLLDNYPKRNSTHGYRHECKDCKRLLLHEYYTTTYNKVRREKKKASIQ